MTDDHQLAAELASAAGDLLVALRAELGFDDPRMLRAEGDRRSHELLVELLARYRPGDAVLSEEGKDDPSRLDAERVWIVDPLDGTREYGEEGRTDWAVHVALWQDGELAAGAVALPAAGSVLATGSPPAERPSPGPTPRVVVSRTRAPDWVTALAGDLGGELLPMGSAGAKIAAVVMGDADVYVHAGGQYEWDSAAPVAVASAAGLHCSRLDGSPLRYNQPDPLLPDLVVCRPDLASDVLARLPR
ncbi:MAG: 3'(2'),5'-bisphosphate nucleotidase CysQ [Frankiaceae bacterium]